MRKKPFFILLKASYLFGALFLITGLLLSAVNIPVQAGEGYQKKSTISTEEVGSNPESTNHLKRKPHNRLLNQPRW